MRILIVDDELSNRRTLEVLLKREGHSVRSASNGTEALTQLQDTPSDVVITDLRMPVMDGMELLAQIKELYPKTHVVMATAFGTIDVAVEAMKIGAWDFITKPIKRQPCFRCSTKSQNVNNCNMKTNNFVPKLPKFAPVGSVNLW